MAVGTGLSLSHLSFWDIGFARHAVPAFVLAFVNVALLYKTAEYFLNNLLMAFVCCSNKVVVGYVEDSPKFLKVLDDFIAQLFGSDALFFGYGLNLLSVLVCASTSLPSSTST